MKAGGRPFPVPALLLLLGAAAWTAPWSGPWSAAALPLLALLALGGCLYFGFLPARGWWGGSLWMGLVALYAWNASHEWIDGRGLVPTSPIRGWPASAFPEGTWETFRLGLAAFAAFALASGLTRRQLRGWQWIAVVAGAAMALAVLAQRLEPNRGSIYERTGIFVNENHFAVYSNLLLPVVLGMSLRARLQAAQEGKPTSPAGLLLLAAALMGAAVVLSRSRAGVLVMAWLVADHVWRAHRTFRQYPFAGMPVSGWVRGAGALAVAASIGFAVQAFGREWGQAGVVAREWAYRAGILNDAFAAFRERPAWGIGPGTFSAVFPYYQSAALEGRTLLHAHCEPVQFLVEYGWAGTLVVLVAVALLLGVRRSVRAGPDEIPPFADLERKAFRSGLVACGLHCMVDFPLRIPLIALVAAAWVGVWAGTRPATPEVPADVDGRN